jgi:hypothetical protein
MKIFKVILLTLIVSLLITGAVFADNDNIKVIKNEQIQILYNSNSQRFKDVTGKIIYPLSYEGTTYLPIRAISCLFKVPINWDGNTKTVSLGEGDLDNITAENISNFSKGSNAEISVILNKGIVIKYLNSAQTFTDVNGKVVYPISYEGTTYLPVRAISNLFGAQIDWDGENKIITITRNNENNQNNGNNGTDVNNENNQTNGNSGTNGNNEGNGAGTTFNKNINGTYTNGKLNIEIVLNEENITATITGLVNNVDVIVSEDFDFITENEAFFEDESDAEKRTLTLKFVEDEIIVTGTSTLSDSFFIKLSGTYTKN